MGWGNPPVPWRDFARSLSWGERDGQRSGTRREPAGRSARSRPRPARDARETPRGGRGDPEWAELHVHSAFSFLDGACTPDELVAEAARLGVRTLALTDHDGMYGAVQLASAARERGVATVFGAELTLDPPVPRGGSPDRTPVGPSGRPEEGRHLLVLARDAEGYRRLCAAISEAQLAGGTKGRPRYDLDRLTEAHGGHWAVLTGCRNGAVPAALAAHGPRAAEAELRELRDRFGAGNVHVELVDHDLPGDDARNDALAALAVRVRAGLVASNNVHYAAPRDARLAQALAALRTRRSLEEMDPWLCAAGTAHLRSGVEMAARLARFPGVLAATAELGRDCAFDLSVVAPRLPDFPVPDGHTEMSWLRALVGRKAPERYGRRPGGAPVSGAVGVSGGAAVLEPVVAPGGGAAADVATASGAAGASDAVASSGAVAASSGAPLSGSAEVAGGGGAPGAAGPGAVAVPGGGATASDAVVGPGSGDAASAVCGPGAAAVPGVPIEPGTGARSGVPTASGTAEVPGTVATPGATATPDVATTPTPALLPEAAARLEHELAVIERLGYAGYFLTVHDIVAFCAEHDILCQGRGSAATSAVCYVLGITNADPIRHQLLFERFLSAGRDGPPDIDLDIEHRRREEVIQYVYRRYGRDRAAQVANVITYRPRLALRDAARALGHSSGQQDAWTRHLDSREWPPPDTAGIPESVVGLADRMLRLPRHLGIHSGGMVICDRPVGEVSPVEWARMPGRSVVQWDKDDCAAVGLVKFDLLGLGMLSCLHDALDLVAAHHGIRHTLATIPPEDPAVYAMLTAADTVGVFQVESRAQMSTLPRLRPRHFYDLVVAVALIRPGPIQGGSVHPYLRRRHGLEPAACPHPSMERALGRTLGVPLFQEQMMQLAIDCADFTAEEADRLRQAMSAKRAPERVAHLHDRLLDGMARRGIPAPLAEEVYRKILAFSHYGFPESHAISFAHLVYASAWVKRHHPAAFTAALLRNQPMGFYHPQTLLADARRHGVPVRGVDINASQVHATLEPVEGQRDQGERNLGSSRRRHPHAPDTPQPAIRLGLSGVRGLGTEAAERVVAARPAAGFTSLEDLARRTALPAAALEALAMAGAFESLGHGRREALWAVGALARVRADQLPGTTPGLDAPPLPPLSPVQQTLADLWATGTSATHPLAHLRADLDRRGVVPTAALRAVPDGAQVAVAGQVTHRQRPETARGVVFLSLEDETGMANVVCPPDVWRAHHPTGARSAALVVHGRLERRDGATNLVAAALRHLPAPTVPNSRDFH